MPRYSSRFPQCFVCHLPVEGKVYYQNKDKELPCHRKCISLIIGLKKQNEPPREIKRRAPKRKRPICHMCKQPIKGKVYYQCGLITLPRHKQCKIWCLYGRRKRE